MAPLTNPSRKRATKRSMEQVLKRLTEDDADISTSKAKAKRDRRWGKRISVGRAKSRKQIRQEERLLKKARNNAFHRKQSVGQLDSIKIEDISEKYKKATEEQKRKKEKQKQQRTQRKQQKREKQIQENEELRKQQLLEAKEYDEKTIRKLEKELHFHKNKKTKKKMLPSIFKADGLDYLLDAVNPDKIGDLDNDEETDDLSAEEDEDDPGLDDENSGDDGEEGEAGELLTGNKVRLDKRKQSDVDDSEDDERTIKRKDKNDATDEDNVTDDEEEGAGLEEEFSDTEIGPHDSITSKKIKASTNIKKKKRKHAGSQRGCNETSDSGNNDGNTVQKEDKSKTLKVKRPVLKMDPYGNIIGEKPPAKTGAYVPPQKRAKMMGEDSKNKEQLERLRKQLKGFLNRLSDSNMKSISGQIEELYLNHSRNDMNETLTELIMQACIGPTLMPDRLVMEQMLLVAVLHTNIGNEVGAYFIQTLAVKFDTLYKDIDGQEADKQCDNIILIFTHLYNLKVIHCTLIYDLIRLLVDAFSEKDIELLLLLLKNCGMMLRKDDPSALKDIILQIQTKALTCPQEFKEQSRVKFMLETIFAIRNNNLHKIPNFDPSHLDHLKKLLRVLVKDRGDLGSGDVLQISFKDLVAAEEKGRWWVVGSAWVGNQQSDPSDSTVAAILGDKASDKISELSRKQRMNTDIRRAVFRIIMTAEDYMDAFEKCLRLGLKGGREREIVHIVIDCCMQEKLFNPYYGFLATKFCHFDRKFKMAYQFSLWDKFKLLSDLSNENTTNLAHLIVHLLAAKALPVSILKVIEFADIDKQTVKFLRTVLLGILKHPEDTLMSVLDIVVDNPQLKTLRDSLRLFLHHFILKALSKKSLGLSEEMQVQVREKVTFADEVLKGEDMALKL